MRTALALLLAVATGCAPPADPGPATPHPAAIPPSAPSAAAGPAPASGAAPAAPETAPVPIDWPGAPPDEIACRWHVTLRRGSEERPRCRWDFYLWRTPTVVETLEGHNQTGETWRRDASGAVVAHERSFHVERKVVEYHAGDLAASSAVPGWERVASLIDPATLGTVLAADGHEDFRGRVLPRWRGTLAGAEFEVLWAADLRIPARIRRRTAAEVLEFDLRAVHPLREAAWPRPRSRSYEWTDFVDVGDRTTDPFFRRLVASGGVLASNCSH